MDTTPRLALPYILPGQAQKHVALNAALQTLDTLCQTSVRSDSQSVEPATPTAGDAYILPASPNGAAWSQMSPGAIAVFTDGAWRAIAPRDGWIAHVADTGQLVVHEGGSWRPAAPACQPLFGVNTQADTVNRLAVKADAELLSHDDVTPGSGNARKVINKNAASATASVLFQDDWSGRAELGLIGSDAFSVRVSPDGQSFQTAISIDADLTLTCAHGVLARTSGLTEFGFSSLPEGLSHADTTPAQGYPSYGALLTVREADNRTFQIHMDGLTGAMKTRCHHINHPASSNNWSAWKKVWSEASQGSGSGLTADRLTVYAASALPSAASRGQGAMIYVTDPAGNWIGVSDGVIWRTVALV